MPTELGECRDETAGAPGGGQPARRRLVTMEGDGATIRDNHQASMGAQELVQELGPLVGHPPRMPQSSAEGSAGARGTPAGGALCPAAELPSAASLQGGRLPDGPCGLTDDLQQGTGEDAQKDRQHRGGAKPAPQEPSVPERG